jgi:carbon-monoxide dehydrogenase large subunit
VPDLPELAGLLNKPQYVGQRILRVEDPRFLTGRATYTDDVHLPGMLEAAFVRSPHAHARIRGIDVARARALPGVRGVFTGQDLAAVMQPFVSQVPGRSDVATLTQHALTLDKARHVGDPVAVVVADSRYLAEDACELVEVDWDELPALVDPEAALEKGAPLIHEGGNNFAHIEFRRGDVDRLFASADHVFSKRFRHGRLSPAPLETRGVVASYEPGSGQVTIWTSSQTPHLVRSVLVDVLGIPESRIRVIADAVGGGFGLKCHVFKEEAVIPAVSRLLGRPVKWIEDRREHLAASVHAKEVHSTIEIATTREGRFLAFRARYVGANGAYQAHPWTALVDAMTTAAALPNLYDIQGVAYTIDCPYTNRCMIGAYRGVGRTPGTTARESLIDDIARALDVDPVELRLRNCISNEPQESMTGAHYDGGSYRECIVRAREVCDYEGFRARQRAALAQGRHLGIGFSPYVEPTAWGADMGKVQGYAQSEIFDAASVTVEPDGSVSVACGLHNHGQGLETSLAQVAADALGVRIEDVRLVMGDTASAPYGFGTHSSRSAVIGGGTILRAAHEVRGKLARIAGHLLEVSPDDLEFRDGRAQVRGVPGRGMTIAEIADVAYFGGARRPPGMEPALTATRSFDPAEVWPNGCVVASVEVDVSTGQVRVEKLWSVEDCGVVVNPMIVEGQTAGALAQALGGALLEEIVYDPDTGQLLTATLVDYLYPSSSEVPPMEFHHLETPSPVTEGGMKGMGEGGLSVAGAAIVNAVADALRPFGVTITRTPLSPKTILALLREARAKQTPA